MVNGELSADRQYIWNGGASGWEPRPMQFRIEGGRLVHVDDPREAEPTVYPRCRAGSLGTVGD